jgi:hypothetical protein
VLLVVTTPKSTRERLRQCISSSSPEMAYNSGTIDDILAKHLPPDGLKEVNRVLYGKELK